MVVIVGCGVSAYCGVAVYRPNDALDWTEFLLPVGINIGGPPSAWYCVGMVVVSGVDAKPDVMLPVSILFMIFVGEVTGVWMTGIPCVFRGHDANC